MGTRSNKTEALEKQAEALAAEIVIPPCPEAAAKLLAVMQSHDPDLELATRLIERDVALAASLLRMANSVYFHRGRQSETVREALSVVGTATACALAAHTLLKRCFPSKPGVSLTRYWDASVAIAGTAVHMAYRLHLQRPDIIYTFALFVDCGIPALALTFDDYKETLRVANESDAESFADIESRRHGTNHVIAGEQLAAAWGFRDDFIQGIRHHHEYNVLDEEYPIEHSAKILIASARLAEHIYQIVTGQGASNEWQKLGPETVAFLGVTDSQMHFLEQSVSEHLIRG